MSPVLDSRGRLFGRASVVDLFVVLLLIALALFAYARFIATDTAEGPYEMTLVVEKVRDPGFAQFEVGDIVTEERGAELGQVASVSVAPSPTEVPTADGGLEIQPSPLFSDISMVVKGRADMSASTIRVGSLVLAAGKVLTVQGPGWEVKPRIASIVRAGG
jgi:hypothetical protein